MYNELVIFPCVADDKNSCEKAKNSIVCSFPFPVNVLFKASKIVNVKYRKMW